MCDKNQNAQGENTVTKAEFLAGAALRVLNKAAAGDVQVIEEDGIPLCVLISPARYRQLLDRTPNEIPTHRTQTAQTPLDEEFADANCKAARIAPLTEEDIEDVLREID
jgi:hypothetical protein